MPAPHRRATLAALAAALVAATLAGCDYVAQRKLVAGQHSEHDVRALMGVPTLVWDRADGGKDWDYVRAITGLNQFRGISAARVRYAEVFQELPVGQTASLPVPEAFGSGRRRISPK